MEMVEMDTAEEEEVEIITEASMDQMDMALLEEMEAVWTSLPFH